MIEAGDTVVRVKASANPHWFGELGEQYVVLATKDNTLSVTDGNFTPSKNFITPPKSGRTKSGTPNFSKGTKSSKGTNFSKGTNLGNQAREVPTAQVCSDSEVLVVNQVCSDSEVLVCSDLTKPTVKLYKPLSIYEYEVNGINFALRAMRLPKDKSRSAGIGSDLKLANKLIKAGPEHAKCMRGIVVHIEYSCQLGWLIEYLTYGVGVWPMSSSSTMHNELLKLAGEALAEEKQAGLSKKVYTRIDVVNYQALRNMYLQRRSHRHPDWQVFCNWVETLPFFSDLIYPESLENQFQQTAQV